MKDSDDICECLHPMKRDGAIDHCPACGTALPTPTALYGETHCPRCDGQLWHLALPSGPTFFVRRPGESIYDLMADVADSRHRLNAKNLEASLRQADAIDLAELFAQLEDRLHS